MGVSFINKKAPVRRLFEPEAFHTGNYKKYSTVGGRHLVPLYIKKRGFLPFSIKKNSIHLL